MPRRSKDTVMCVCVRVCVCVCVCVRVCVSSVCLCVCAFDAPPASATLPIQKPIVLKAPAWVRVCMHICVRVCLRVVHARIYKRVRQSDVRLRAAKPCGGTRNDSRMLHAVHT